MDKSKTKFPAPFTSNLARTRARVAELDAYLRKNILSVRSRLSLSARIDEEWFGLSFNEKCGDGYAYAGTDLTRLGRTMKGHGMIWPHDVDRDNPPTDGSGPSRPPSMTVILASYGAGASDGVAVLSSDHG